MWDSYSEDAAHDADVMMTQGKKIERSPYYDVSKDGKSIVKRPNPFK